MKVLIVSHNCFSTTQNMGKTLASFFNLFNKDELMQLYLYPSLPDTKICENYYRITDKEALHSIFKRGKCGRRILAEEISESNELFESADEAHTYGEMNRNSNTVRRARDLVWCFGNWKTNDLKQWLDEGKPDVVFYALGDAIFSQNIAMWVADYLNIPLITYVCDEFYFTNKKSSFLTRLINWPLIKNIAKIQKKAAQTISICDSLGEKYKETFGTPYTTVMTGSSFKAEQYKDNSDSNRISYIGNLGLNRWKSLLDISDVINRLNRENNWKYKLTYYGGENENLKGKVNFGGTLNNHQVKETMDSSFMLIHTETFDSEYADRLKYSVSTKIADSLACGVPLLAYGPENLASMEYLINNNCAVCVTDPGKLYKTLEKFFKDNQLRKNITENALKAARKYHSSENAGLLLKEIIGGIVEEN